MRHGRDYDDMHDWGERMKGDGPIAELIGARFAAAKRRYVASTAWGRSRRWT